MIRLSATLLVSRVWKNGEYPVESALKRYLWTVMTVAGMFIQTAAAQDSNDLNDLFETDPPTVEAPQENRPDDLPLEPTKQNTDVVPDLPVAEEEDQITPLGDTTPITPEAYPSLNIPSEHAIGDQLTALPTREKKQSPKWIETDPIREANDDSEDTQTGNALTGNMETLSSGTRLWRGHWYTELNIVMMRMQSPRPRRIANDISSGVPINQNLLPIRRLTTITDTHGFESGMEVTFGNILGRDRNNRDHSIEFTYLGLLEWTSRANLESFEPGKISTSLVASGLRNPLTDGDVNGIPDVVEDAHGFIGADQQAFTLKSQLDNYEWNYRIRNRLRKDRMVMRPDGNWARENNPGQIWSLLGGLRYTTLDEQFLYTSSGSADVANGRFHVGTENHMFGLQAGFDFREQRRNWFLDLQGRFGGLVNFINRQTDLNVPDTSSLFSGSHSLDDEHMTFVTELRLTAGYQLFPHVSTRFSYEIAFYEGLALAAENIDLGSTDSPLNSDGNSLFHGFFWGLDIVW